MYQLSQIFTISFRKKTVLVVEIDGVPHIAMRSFVENMGLGWIGQVARLKDAKYDCKFIKTGKIKNGQPQYVVYMPLDELNGWFEGFNLSKIANRKLLASIQYYSQLAHPSIKEAYQAINRKV